MKRSLWKVPFVAPEFFSLKKIDKPFSSFSRSSFISKYFLNKKILIYSGKNWIKVTIQKTMLGYKTGEFSLTKVFGRAIAVSMAKKAKAKMRAKKSKK